MALRDHSLDHKITAAAMKEFSDKGYTGASLRKIAERAGVTVGAIQTRYDGIVQSKLEESVAFFRYAGHIDIDERLMGLLISAQFDSYRRIVAECGDRKSAKEYMERLMTYHFGGWAALFDSADRLQEGMFNEV